jgi:hypothetical protein
MAQKIVTLCDAHQANDEEAAGTPWEVTLRGPGLTKGATWEIDLCEQDGKTLTDLAVMLDAVGRRTAGKAPATAARTTTGPRAHTARTGTPRGHEVPTNPDGSATCPVPGCGKVPSSRSALASHLRSNHDNMTLAEAYGWPMPYECPECGKRSDRPQGLAAHRRQAHGVAGEGSSGD